MSNGTSTQDSHLIRLYTVLGENALIAEDFTSTESMSQGFVFDVSAFSDTRHELGPKDLVGTLVTIGLVQMDQSIRYFNGYVSELTGVGTSKVGQKTHYQLTITSWLELLLARRVDCRVLQDKTVADILREIFKSYSEVASFEIDPSIEKLPIRRFRVQYNETDLEFFNRICKQEGIAYYFTHKEGAHKLHLVDTSDSLAVLESKTVKLQIGTPDYDHLTEWKSAASFVTGNYTQRSYNYMSPSKDLTAAGKVTSDIANAPRVMDVESYRYSEGFHDDGEGKLDTQHRVNQGIERSQVSIGSGNCRDLMIGQHFQVELENGGGFVDKGKTFTFIQVVIQADETEGAAKCTVEAVPKGELVYPIVGNPTVISSLQTAVVTGPPGEEIHSDEHGRVKVQFHWDRLGKKDDNTSCWLRVMQSFAGPGFGAHFTPRVGQEVVVAFENGNPDRPFVMGALYHTENPPPYAEHKGTRSGIRTRSTKQGAATNCNELYFEDKKDQEEVYFQAERDYNSVIKNDQTLAITNNKTETIGNDLNLTVENDKFETITNNETHNVGRELLIEAGEKILIKVGDSEIEITAETIIIKSGTVDILQGGAVPEEVIEEEIVDELIEQPAAELLDGALV